MTKSDDELDAKKWRRFFAIFDQLGIYPAKYGDKERNAYGEGWNACQAQLLACYGIMEDFYNHFDPSLADKVERLNKDEIVFFHIKEPDFLNPVEMSVLCNDLFWWACADMEDVAIDEIPELYETCYDENGNRIRWGSDIWCCLHRGMRPQHPIEDQMKKEGVWTKELEALPIRENTG